MKQDQSNPTKDGACNWDQRVKAEWKKIGPQLGSLLSQRVVAYPGATMTEHRLHSQYEFGHTVHDGKTTKTTFA